MTDALTKFLMESGASLGQQAIQSSIVAVASAMLARVRNAPSLREAARREYGSTLKLVNAALADPVESMTNQTLGAVVLMSLFEVIAQSNKKREKGQQKINSNTDIVRSSYQERHRELKAGQTTSLELQPCWTTEALDN